MIALSPPHEDPAASSRSILFPYFFFRTTGFPVELLDGLACPASLELARQTLEAEEVLENTVSGFKRALSSFVHDGRKSPALNRIARKVGRGRRVGDALLDRLREEGLDDWLVDIETYNRVVDDLDGLRVRGDAVLRRELSESREHLRRIASDPRFREAVLLSSPGAYRGLERFVRGAKVNRNTERKALLYLQRFCAKNDTISFFGPVSWGYFDPECEANLDVAWSGEISGRYVYFEHWMAERLAEAMEDDPDLASHLEWRVHFPFEWEGGTLYRHHTVAGRTRRRVEEEERALLDALDAGARVPTSPAFEELRKQGAVRAFVLGVEELHPVESLLDRLVESVPTAPRRRWERRLRWLLAVRDRFAVGDVEARSELFARLERRFSEWVGGEARRLGGQTYAARNLLYEDCTRVPERFVLGGRLQQDLAADLRSILVVQSTLMELVEPYGWRHLEETFEKVARGGKRVPLTKFLLKLSGGVGTGYLNHSLVGREDEEALLEEAERRLRFRTRDDGRLEVEARDESVFDRVALLERPVVLAADVMLAAADGQAVERGDFEFVVGEVQYFPVGYPEYFAGFHPDPGAFARDYRERVVEPRQRTHSLARLELEPEATRLIRVEQPLAETLIVDSHPRTYRLPQRRVTELTVELGDGEMLVRDRQGERFVLANPHHDLFLDTAWRLLMQLFERRCAHALASGRRPPELCIGRRTVLARRSWRLDAAALEPARAKRRDPWRESPFSAFVDMQRLRSANDLPRHVFARVPGEVKPVLVDFDCPVTLENLACMVPPDEGLELSEMSPAPGRLWHTSERGHHTSEMRVFLT